MTTQHPMMTREIRTTQRGVRVHYIELDGSATTAGFSTTGLSQGQEHATVREDAAGEYTVKLNDPGERALLVYGAALATAAEYITWARTANKGEYKVYHWDDAGLAVADGTLTLACVASTAAEET